MFEIYLLIYACAVIVVTYATLKHHGLLAKPPIQQLQEKATLAEEAMKTLHGTACPLCGAKTIVEAVDFLETNMAILVCERCSQKTLWKLDRHVWKMIAPYKWTPKLTTQLPAKTEVKSEEEEVKLVFA
jgi:DNA-directed RNA polymerase subunit RPC12/RpoP